MSKIYKTFDDWDDDCTDENCSFPNIDHRCYRCCWAASRKEPEDRIKRALELLQKVSSTEYVEDCEMLSKAINILKGEQNESK